MKPTSHVLWMLLILMGTSQVVAQEGRSSLPISDPIQAAISAQTRTLSGVPGPAYWVNHASYDLTATIDPESRRITAKGSIVYHNESPDTLSELVLRLYQNIYQANAERDDALPAEDFTNGLELQALVVTGDTLVQGDSMQGVRLDGTNLWVSLPSPLLPGDSVRLEADWAFTISAGGDIRMGTYGTHSYFVAYWYPQVAVYDDVWGWDTVQYTGQHEFYQDFNDYQLRISAPDSLLVWATGTLQNPDDVLTPTYAARFKAALSSDEVVRIVSEEDYLGDSVIAQPQGMNSWYFQAENLPDVAFALSDYYYWDATSVEIDSPARRVLTDACYQPGSRDFYQVAAFARDIIAFMSDSLPGIAYPYPAMTVYNGSTEGFGGGMEFPMIVNDGSSYAYSAAFRLTHHELAHTYFPFMMGINEHRYAFMDEGWASFLPADLMAIRGYSATPMYWNVASYAGFAGNKNEQPLMTDARTLFNQPYYSNAYYKPATAYHILRGVMGAESFREALQTYIRRWAGKHPLPYDFFYTFEEVAGESLDWFWRPWFFETTAPDLGLNIVKLKGKKLSLDVQNVGGLPVPIHLRVTLSNGAKRRFDFPASVWKEGNETFRFDRKFSHRIIEIDLGRGDVPDVDDANNSFDTKN